MQLSPGPLRDEGEYEGTMRAFYGALVSDWHIRMTHRGLSISYACQLCQPTPPNPFTSSPSTPLLLSLNTNARKLRRRAGVPFTSPRTPSPGFSFDDCPVLALPHLHKAAGSLYAELSCIASSQPRSGPMPSSPTGATLPSVAAPPPGTRPTATNASGSTPSPPFDFHTVTCVTWSASGRNIGVGTPDGFIIYSTESLVSHLSSSVPAPSPSSRAEDTSSDRVAGTVQEVCRSVVYGGVGLLSLYKQCSIVAFAGVQRRSAATRVQLADMSRAAPPDFYTTPDVAQKTATAAAPRSKPWPAEEDAAAAQWYERWRVSVFANTAAAAATTLRTLAAVECPLTVVGLEYCPHVVTVATSGDPNVVGSHSLHIFDHNLRPLYTLPVYPPSSNAYLKDMIAIAATSTTSNGAGMNVQRLRVLLPGEKRGEVRLLTFKKSQLTADGGHDSYTSRHGFGDTHRLVDKVLHQAPLRAVAISEDGKSGVTMGEQGRRIVVLDFISDDKITKRLTLDRGHLPAVVDTVALAIVAVPQPHHALRHAGAGAAVAYAHERCGSSSEHNNNAAVGGVHVGESGGSQYQRLTEVVHDIVVCLTSSGTMHVFGCGLQKVLFYYSDKSMLPRVGYPYAFSVCVPSLLVRDGAAVLFVVRSDIDTTAAHYLPRHERHQSIYKAQRHGWSDETAQLPGELFAFQLRYHTGYNGACAGDGMGDERGPLSSGSSSSGSGARCHAIACFSLSAS